MPRKRNPVKDNKETLLGIGGLAVAGTGLFLYLKSKGITLPNITEFRNLKADYGSLPVKVYPKGQTSFRLFVEYFGPGGEFDMGVGLAEASPLMALEKLSIEGFIWQVVMFPPASAWKEVVIDITGEVPALPSGKYDAMKFIQTKDGLRDIGGTGYKLADWDDDVFLIETQTVDDQVLVLDIAMGVE